MKRFLSLLLLVAVGIAAFGYYRGWYHLDQAKIEADEQQAKHEVQVLGQKVKAKTGEVADKIKQK